MTTDIQELFARDPLDLTSPDITAIVEKLRASRKQFASGVSNAGTLKTARKKSDAAKAADKVGEAVQGKLSLDDLL